MGGTALVEAHAERRDVAGCGLVHVVPDTRDAGGDVRGVKFAPPRAALVGGEVREGGVTGPDLADVGIPAVGAAQHVAFLCLVVDPVAGVPFDAGVHDGREAEAVVGEFGDHRVWIGEEFVVPGEDPVAIHVLNVQPQPIAWDFIAA